MERQELSALPDEALYALSDKLEGERWDLAVRINDLDKRIEDINNILNYRQILSSKTVNPDVAAELVESQEPQTSTSVKRTSFWGGLSEWGANLLGRSTKDKEVVGQ